GACVRRCINIRTEFLRRPYAPERTQLIVLKLMVRNQLLKSSIREPRRFVINYKMRRFDAPTKKRFGVRTVPRDIEGGGICEEKYRRQRERCNPTRSCATWRCFEGERLTPKRCPR